MNLVIREACFDDLDMIVRLIAEGSRDPRQEGGSGADDVERAFHDLDHDRNNVLLVVELGREVVGFLQMTLIPGLTRQGETRAHLEAVRVAGSARDRGVGSALIEEAIRRARAAGCGSMQLLTHRSRRDAHRFYERLGFERSHIGMKLRL